MINYKKHLFLISFLQVLIINSPAYAQEPKDLPTLDELKTELEIIQKECPNDKNGEKLFQDINELKKNTKEIKKKLNSNKSENTVAQTQEDIDEFLQEISYAKYDCITQITWVKLSITPEPPVINVAPAEPKPPVINIASDEKEKEDLEKFIDWALLLSLVTFSVEQLSKFIKFVVNSYNQMGRTFLSTEENSRDLESQPEATEEQ